MTWPLLLPLIPGVTLWWLWVHGGDGQRFYRAMGWTHPAITGKPQRANPSEVT